VRVLDTDILIDLSRGYPPASAWFASLNDLSLIPGYVVFELVAGCDNALAVRRLHRWLRPFPIYWPSTADCDRALTTFARLGLSHNLGILDALGVPLCTFNVRHFRAIAGLTTEQPYARI
jgi:predicted nucleic acid-binding protein